MVHPSDTSIFMVYLAYIKESRMKKQTTEMVAYCSLLLSLIIISGPISGAASSFMGTSTPPTSGATNAAVSSSGRHSHADTHKRWKRKIDEMETIIDRLEEKAKTLREGSASRRKADNLLKKIRYLQKKQKDIPGEIYRLMMDLKAYLATV